MSRALVFTSVGLIAAAGVLRQRGSTNSLVIYGPRRNKLPPVRRSLRGVRGKASYPGFTTDEIIEAWSQWLGDDDEPAVQTLVAELNTLDERSSHRDVYDVLSRASDVLGGHGVEQLYPHGGPGGFYVNMGDTYALTLVYTDRDGPMLTTWGDIIESPPAQDQEYHCEHCGHESWGDDFYNRTCCNDCQAQQYGE